MDILVSLWQGETRLLALFKGHVIDQIFSALDALSHKNISSGSNCDDVRVFTEWFKRNGIMKFTRRLFARIVQGDEVSGLQWLFRDRIFIVVLPSTG